MSNDLNPSQFHLCRRGVFHGQTFFTQLSRQLLLHNSSTYLDSIAANETIQLDEGKSATANNMKICNGLLLSPATVLLCAFSPNM